MGVNCSELRTDWKLGIDAGMVLRAMGATPEAIRARQPRFVDLVETVVAKHQDCLRPSAAIREIAVREETPYGLMLENGVQLHGPTLSRRLAGSECVVAVVGAIASDFERCAQARDLVHSLIVDALGTVAITALTNSIFREVRAMVRERRLNATHPLFPGMKGWELAAGQAQIFALVDGRAAGVSLNESFMMTPRKSVAFVIGIGAQVAEGPGACEDCQAAAHCRHQTPSYAC